MEFSRLKDLREDAEKTQLEVASFLYCSERAYWNYEKGVREIPASMVVKLAKYYKTSTDYILGLTNNPEPPAR